MGWHVMLLHFADGPYLADVARQTHLPALAPDEREVLDGLTTGVAEAVRAAKSAIGVRRLFSGSKKRESGSIAAEYLTAYAEWAPTAGLQEFLAGLARDRNVIFHEPALADALTDPFRRLRGRLWSTAFR